MIGWLGECDRVKCCEQDWLGERDHVKYSDKHVSQLYLITDCGAVIIIVLLLGSFFLKSPPPPSPGPYLDTIHKQRHPSNVSYMYYTVYVYANTTTIF